MTDATKMSPAVGDVVPIGTLPAGAVVEWPVYDDGAHGPASRATLRKRHERGGWHVSEGDSGLLTGAIADVSLARVVSLPVPQTYAATAGTYADPSGRYVSPPDAPAAPVSESEAVTAWHLRATEAQAALAAMTAERDMWQRSARDYLDSRDDALRLCADRDEWKRIAETTAQQVRGVTAERDEAKRRWDDDVAKVLTRETAAIRERDEARSERDDAMRTWDVIRAEHVEMIREHAEERTRLTAELAAVATLRSDLDARDAQEGARVLAWADAADLEPCSACWYPCDPGGRMCPQCFAEAGDA